MREDNSLKWPKRLFSQMTKVKHIQKAIISTNEAREGTGVLSANLDERSSHAQRYVIQEELPQLTSVSIFTSWRMNYEYISL